MVYDLEKNIGNLQNTNRSLLDKLFGCESTIKRLIKQNEMLEDKVTRISHKVLEFQDKLTEAQYDNILLEINKEIK